MGRFGRKSKPEKHASNESQARAEGLARAARFIDLTGKLTKAEWLVVLERGGKYFATHRTLTQEATVAVRTATAQAGLWDAAGDMAARVDLSGLLPPYPRPEHRKPIEDAMRTTIAAILVSERLPSKHLGLVYYPYAD